MTTPTVKRIILCADDYGQALEISQAILALIQAGRISATTCLVNTAHWASHAGLLIPFWRQIDIGLHLNLTEGHPLSLSWQTIIGKKFTGLATLWRDVLLGRINQTVIEAECNAQLDQFISQMGTLPDFIDGHQHIHQFPVIREAIINIYLTRMKTSAYLRWVNEAINWTDYVSCFKKLIVFYSGTRAFKKLLDLHLIPHNQSFSGMYSFKGNYSYLFKNFLRKVEDKGLIMCHPATKETNEPHPIAKARPKEYLYLLSDEFVQDREKFGVNITRFSCIN